MSSAINAAILWDPRTSAVPMDASSNQAGQSSTGALSVDKTEFLNLLVTQLKNQDPLNPVDSQDFVAQLATFSSLEQLMDINKAVTKLAGGTDQQTSDSTNGISGS